MNTETQTITKKAAELAKSKGVALTQLWTTDLAQAITRLADDEVEQDDTEKLLVLLRQEGHLDANTFGQWLHQHLMEVGRPSHVP